jgi:hypothetical protein
VVDEVIETGLAPRGDAVLIVEGNSQDLGNFLQKGLLVGGELAPPPCG